MPDPKKKKTGYSMTPGSKEKDTLGSFSEKNTKTISAFTTTKNALASDADYQLVPGYEERLGGELKGVTVTAKRKPSKSSYNKKKSYGKGGAQSHIGKALRWSSTFITGDRYKRRQVEKQASKGIL